MIYFNSELTKYNQESFTSTGEFKKEINYKYSWIKSGRVMLRKDEMTPAKAINKIGDLPKKLINNYKAKTIFINIHSLRNNLNEID